MAKYKGSGIEVIRALVKARGPEFERRFLERLSPQGRELFQHALAVSWIDFKDDPGDIPVGADMLFPGDPERIAKFGRLAAREAMSGIYKVFLRIPTKAYIIKRIAVLWRTNFDTGTAGVENIRNGQADFVIRDFPEFPEYQLDFLGGYIAGMLELTGSPNPQVVITDRNPQAWRFQITWD
ncbi:MAG: hypothetical protein AB1439_04980 [candidate division FCPU426 bacterium]